MKKCPYCGKEYPDEALACAIDGEPLPDNTPQLAVTEERTVDTVPHKEEPYLTFPDYQWSARDAWKCIGMIVIFEIVLGLVTFTLGLHFPNFRRWQGTGFGFFSRSIVHYSICLLTAAYFARTETLIIFWKAFGLDRKPSDYVWFGLVMALVLRFISHFMIIHGWGRGVANEDITGFRNTPGLNRYFFLIPLLLFAPLFEEPLYRGFLYKAFRGSFAMAPSVVLIVAWTINNHWYKYYQSFQEAFILSCFVFILCFLREKSDSLWDCICFHFVFNASLLFVSAPLR